MIENIKKLWKERKDQYHYAHWLFLYSKPYIGRIILLMSIGLVSTVISLVMTLVTKKIIDDATTGQKDSLITFILYYLGLIALLQVIGIVDSLLSTMVYEKFSFGIRKQVYEKIINSQWTKVKNYHTGDLMTRLTTDAGNIADGIIWTIPGIIILFIELLMVFFTLLFFSPILAIFSIMIAPVGTLMAWWLGRKLKKLQNKVLENESAYRSYLQESLANLLIIKSFSNEKQALDKLTILREECFFWIYKKTKLGLVSSIPMSLTFQVSYIVAFAYGALQVATNAITFGTMSVFMSLVNRVQSPILQLAQNVPKIVSILTSASRVIELECIPEEERLNQQISPEEIGVKLDQVSFGYTDEKILSEVSLKIEPGEIVAIVGESGIGKTTLIHMIMSLLINNHGSITFYNTAGEEVKSCASSRRLLSYVPQGNTLFSGTIRDNILYGKEDATDEEIFRALKLASCDEFINELPNGLDTVIGERGHGLSEGQAQRIAIGRAFVKNSPFLILDEATSALDEKTELNVINGLRQLNPKPTCLIITHRKSILAYCDRELHITNKKVSEE